MANIVQKETRAGEFDLLYQIEDVPPWHIVLIMALQVNQDAY